MSINTGADDYMTAVLVSDLIMRGWIPYSSCSRKIGWNIRGLPYAWKQNSYEGMSSSCRRINLSFACTVWLKVILRRGGL